MKQKLTGITTVVAITLTVLLAIITRLSGEFFSASNVQLLMVLFTVSIVFVGIYLLQSLATETNKKAKLLITIFGFLLILISPLISFNIIDFLSAYNWLISGAILYISLVQLHILQWGVSKTVLTKICSFALISFNAFLIIYFIGTWRYSGISMWISIATWGSVFSFLAGLITTYKKRPAQQN